MIRAALFLLLVIALIFAFEGGISQLDTADPNLKYLDRYKIKDKSAGLTEPSGLALSHDGKSLWTVSDKTAKIFKLNLKGKLLEEESFDIPDQGLEGIAPDPSGEFLFVVKETGNEIIKINVNTREVVDRKPLSEMTGYENIKQYFENSPLNKGLEGITWNTGTGSIFVVKEAVPGMLIEVSGDLKTIQNHVLLTEENGFADENVSGDVLDFSGICYDGNRKQFWIVSDKGQKLFLYDPQQNRVTQNINLGYVKKGRYQEINKAEGVALVPGDDRIYIVSDKEARLYLYDYLKTP